MSKLEELLKKAELPWDSHSGLDYTVIMIKSDECTEDASLMVHGQNADQLAQIAVLAVNNIGLCMEVLRDAAGVINTAIAVTRSPESFNFEVLFTAWVKTLHKVQKALAELEGAAQCVRKKN